MIYWPTYSSWFSKLSFRQWLSWPRRWAAAAAAAAAALQQQVCCFLERLLGLRTAPVTQPPTITSSFFQILINNFNEYKGLKSVTFIWPKLGNYNFVVLNKKSSLSCLHAPLIQPNPGLQLKWVHQQQHQQSVHYLVKDYLKISPSEHSRLTAVWTLVLPSHLVKVLISKRKVEITCNARRPCSCLDRPAGSLGAWLLRWGRPPENNSCFWEANKRGGCVCVYRVWEDDVGGQWSCGHLWAENENWDVDAGEGRGQEGHGGEHVQPAVAAGYLQWLGLELEKTGLEFQEPVGIPEILRPNHKSRAATHWHWFTQYFTFEIPKGMIFFKIFRKGKGANFK